MNIQDIVKSLKKEFGNEFVHQIDDPDLHSHINYWIPTGSTLLDSIIRNGIPGRRITEISGAYSTGKSALSYSILANTQRIGGVAVLLDTESAIDSEFATKLGVDLKELILAQPETVEDTYDTLFTLIPKLREKIPQEQPITVIIDSCTPPCKEELEKDLSEEPKMAANAKAQRRGLRKLSPMLGNFNVTCVGIQHTTANIGGYGPKVNSTGGTAWGFWPAVRLRTSASKIFDNQDSKKVLGIEINVEVIKNKVGRPHRTCSIPLYYEAGLDDVKSVVQFGRENGIFGVTKGWYTWKDQKYRETQFIEMVKSDNSLKEEVFKLVKDVLG